MPKGDGDGTGLDPSPAPVSSTEYLVLSENMLEKNDADNERQRAELQKQCEEQLAALNDKWAKENAELQEKLNAALREVEALTEFKEKQAEIEETIAKLQLDNDELQRNEVAKLQEMERKFIAQNTMQQKEFEAKLEDLKRAADNDIDERLDASVKRILAQNRRMGEELRLHVSETDKLLHEKNFLEEEKKRLERELGLKAEIEVEYAKRGTKQQREIKEHLGKVRSLERSLGQLMKDFEYEREQLLAKQAQEMADLHMEQAGLKRLVKLKAKELKNIRRLAQEVLYQRADVEQFLIDSLELVKAEIQRENVASGKLPRIPSNREKLTPLPSGVGTPKTGPTGAGGGVDISQLTWEDREKVLRLLFSRINNGSANGMAMPPHSFEVEAVDPMAAGGAGLGATNPKNMGHMSEPNRPEVA
eukprot:jgi/Mesvir1/28727/Mv19695-RA.1